MPATYEPIATTTLGSATTSITFSSIPATYTDLRLVIAVSSASGGFNIRTQFNSDTGANYSSTWLQGDGSVASSSRNTGLTYLQFFAGESSTLPTLRTLDLFSYSGSKLKTGLMTGSNDYNGSGYVSRQVGLWSSTAAINTIYLFLSGVSQTFSIGTTATLYGILKA